ncbi:V-type sodium ATPase subunit D [archaeon BMS3Bbin15]|nr:V-type sodium ATPase subunit D [archaeon BMS3Bbin15]
MAELIEGVNPTRMELLKLKTKVKLARKGHRLLKEKRDALIVEFFNILEEARGIRRRAERSLADAFIAIILAQSTLGVLKVREVSFAVKETHEVNTVTRSIMGVRVPVLEIEDENRTLMERGYSLSDTNYMVDEAAKKFEEALTAVVELAEVESSIRLLSQEIKVTKRRVNALENIVMPRLDATVKYIRMRLDEMERENFFKLKRIKASQERKEAEATA